jgi:extracellular factor (EF) 3-hydroxypalmitic acid methyl ester biosynthesis protein
MHDALNLIRDLSEADITWFLEVGQERSFPAGAAIIAEGSETLDLYFVLHGTAALHLAALGDARVATLGPGELLGEISFLEGRPASATVRALEDVTLLAVPRQAVLRRSEDEPEFGARLYHAFARVLARRLRERVPAWGPGAGTASAQHASWRRVSDVLERFKVAVQEADQAAVAHHGQTPGREVAALRAAFDEIVLVSGQVLQGEEHRDPASKDALGAALQRELLPYMLLARSPERAYSKPRGYAGDYLIIEWIYRAEAVGTGRVGPLIDRCFLDLPVAQAVRNRRALLATEIRRAFETHRAEESGEVRVTSMACGPARELFDVFERLDASTSLKAWLIDIDAEAIEFVQRQRDIQGLDKRMELHLANLVYLATGRQRLELPPQDLVYSIGLIDYFDDRFVVNLIDYAHDLLAPGGRLILGNFHPRNPYRALMECVLDWKLIHRTEEDMNRLYAASRFGRSCSRILFESEGLNMFAECVKQA